MQRVIEKIQFSFERIRVLCIIRIHCCGPNIEIDYFYSMLMSLTLAHRCTNMTYMIMDVESASKGKTCQIKQFIIQSFDRCDTANKYNMDMHS